MRTVEATTTSRKPAHNMEEHANAHALRSSYSWGSHVDDDDLVYLGQLVVVLEPAAGHVRMLWGGYRGEVNTTTCNNLDE